MITGLLLRTVLIGIAALLLVIFIVIMTTRRITRPIVRIAEVFKRMSEAEGDLTFRLDEGRKDELGMLARHFNGYMERNQEFLREVRDIGLRVAECSHGASATDIELRDGTSTQASALQEISASIEEMSVSANQNSKNALRTKDTAMEATDKTKSGAEALGRTLSSMRLIAQKIGIVEEIARNTQSPRLERGHRGGSGGPRAARASPS